MAKKQILEEATCDLQSITSQAVGTEGLSHPGVAAQLSQHRGEAQEANRGWLTAWHPRWPARDPQTPLVSLTVT